MKQMNIIYQHNWFYKCILYLCCDLHKLNCSLINTDIHTFEVNLFNRQIWGLLLKQTMWINSWKRTNEWEKPLVFWVLSPWPGNCFSFISRSSTLSLWKPERETNATIVNIMGAVTRTWLGKVNVVSLNEVRERIGGQPLQYSEGSTVRMFWNVKFAVDECWNTDHIWEEYVS